jgi:hypothetical protein
MANTGNAGLSNTTTLTTNFNVEPYYDDFDKFTNYNRILFRPGYALQARELTQLQTALQNQVSTLGKHIFKEGSIVLDGYTNIDQLVSYIRVNDTDASSATVTISDYVGLTMIGGTSGVKFTVFKSATATDATDADSNTLFVSYQNSGDNNTSKTVTAGETLTATDGSGRTLVVKASSATGLGSMFTISDGVFYAKEHFIYFYKQSIILSAYNNNPSCKVGFFISEDIIRYNQDQSLLDPAQGSSNYSAPGADRLKLTPSLYRIDFNQVVGPPDYVALFSISNGVITELFNKPQYSVIQEYFAQRTYDESGDYVVEGFDTTIRENLDDGTNLGYSSTGSSSNLSVLVSPGKAYVKGYEVGKKTTKDLVTEKATTFANVNNQIGATTHGNYFLIKEVSGRIQHDVGTAIDLYNTAQARLTNVTPNAAQTGNRIGTARLKSVEYDSGTSGTPSATWRLYLTDIQMIGSNSVSTIRSVFQDNADADFGGDIVTYSNNAILYEPTVPLIYNIGYPAIRKVRATDGTVDASFSYKKSEAVTISTGGTFSLSLSGGETFPYGTSGTLTSLQERDIALTFTTGPTNLSMSGTITSGGGTTLNGTTTFFRDRLNVGDRITLSSNNNTYYIITSIANNSTLTVDKTVPFISSNTFFKVYQSGDIVDLVTVGSAAGVQRTVTVGSNTSITVDLKETFATTKSAYVSYRVVKSAAQEAAKTLNAQRYVIINCATAGTNGPFSLGFPDIYQVRQIRQKTGSTFSSASEGTAVTSFFTVDNGQTDDFYDFGTIKPKGITLGATDYLLVELDYFYPDFSQGQGYFSIDSYPVNDTSPSSSQLKTSQIPIYKSPATGAVYDLRNVLDFRPVKARTATDSTTVGAASTNPAASAGFYYAGSAMKLGAPGQQITYDFSYYLPRKDLVVIDKDNNFNILKGVPTSSPITPTGPDNSMAIASLYISPYPSIAPSYASILRRNDLACKVTKLGTERLTMRDLQTMKQRIENLEYYAALSLLEKAAVDLRVIDPTTGNDRFKNGIFVDTFADHSLGSGFHPEYRITVDPIEKSIRPIYDMFSIPYRLISNTDCNIVGDYIVLPYTEQKFFTQNVATTTRNMETDVYRFYGTLDIVPPNDNWIDVRTAPEGTTVAYANVDLYDGGPLTTKWNAYQAHITGYNVIYTDAQGKTRKDAITGVAPGNIENYVQVNYASQFGSVTLESVTDYSRTGTEKYLNTTSSSQDLGTRVVDSGPILTIRGQSLQLRAAGVKANTKFYTFFDGQNMTNYTRPLTSNGAYAGANSANIISTANNEIFAEMQIPDPITGGKKFYTGVKEVVLTDSPTNESDATSSARGYFAASSFYELKQGTILTTRKTVVAERAVSSGFTEYPTTRIDPPVIAETGGSCMAYSFYVQTPEGEEGLFLSSVDVYIAAKSETLGFWVEVREMDSGGGITTTQVPLSDVVFSNTQQIITSTDASKAMNIKFKVPIFLYDKTQYAFILHPMGQNPDMYFHVAKLGQDDITGTISGTTKQYTSRAQTGSLYNTNNNRNWRQLSDLDLKINFYRAVFDTTKTGTLVIGNEPFEFFRLSNVSSSFNYYGETVQSFDGLTLGSITGGSIANGNILVGQTTGANGSVVSNVGIYIIANTGYAVSESIYVYSSAMVDTGVRATVTALSDRAKANVYNYRVNLSNNTLLLSGSNGKFTIGNSFIGLVTKKTAKLANVDNLAYSTIDFEPTYLSFNKTTASFEMQAGSGSYVRINHNQNYTFGTEQILYSSSAVGGAPTNNVRITLKSSSSNGYLSPVIDLRKLHSIYVRNLVNANTDNENTVAGGALINKYISKTVNLAQGQDAEDIKVVLTAYRPPTSNIKVYAKISAAEDSEQLNKKPWVELTYADTTQYSSLADPNDFQEYSFGFPSVAYDRITLSNYGGSQINIGDLIYSNTNTNIVINYSVTAVEGNTVTLSGTGYTVNAVSGGWANVRASDGVTIRGNANIAFVGSTAATIGVDGATTGIVKYTTDSGVPFLRYKQFAIKIGLTSDNQAVVPRVADLRVIALQK